MLAAQPVFGWSGVVAAAAAEPPVSGGRTELGALAQRAATGDVNAFRAWAETVTPAVFRVAARMLDSRAEAEDVVQETLVRAWQHLPELREPAASLGWACHMARNAATDRLRQRKHRWTESLDAPEGTEGQKLAAQLADPRVDPEEVLHSAGARAAVRAAVAQLPDQHRLVLMLRDLDGMSAPETAEALGLPVGTVDSRLHRARAALAKKIRGMMTRKQWRPW